MLMIINTLSTNQFFGPSDLLLLEQILFLRVMLFLDTYIDLYMPIYTLYHLCLATNIHPPSNSFFGEKKIQQTSGNRLIPAPMHVWYIPNVLWQPNQTKPYITHIYQIYKYMGYISNRNSGWAEGMGIIICPKRFLHTEPWLCLLMLCSMAINFNHPETHTHTPIYIGGIINP